MFPVGSPATGVDFIDREKLVLHIESLLEKNSILLVSPRRFGKTSIMRKVETDLQEKKIPCIFIDVERVTTPLELITELIMAITESKFISRKTKILSSLKRTPSIIKENIQEIGLSDFNAKLRDNKEEDIDKVWRAKALEISKLVREIDSDVVILMDEFPIAIQKMQKTDANKFLNWFRGIRQTNLNLKFVLAGSVSIDSTIRDLGGVAVLNDVKRVKVEGFEESVALNIIYQVFKEKGIYYSENLGKTILQCIGLPYIPYFLMIMLSAVTEEFEIYERDINEEEIVAIYENRILGAEGIHYFEHYYRRINDYYRTKYRNAILLVLSEISKVSDYPMHLAFGVFLSETGENDPDAFNNLISELSNDFYIEKVKNDNLRFYSKMLKDYWRKYHASI